MAEKYFGDYRVAICTAKNEDLLLKKGYYSGLGDIGVSKLWTTARSGPPPDFVNEVSSQPNLFTHFSMVVFVLQHES